MSDDQAQVEVDAHSQVEVVIPWRDTGDERRRRNLDWVVANLRSHYPDWGVTLAADGDDGPFNRSAAIINGALTSEADVIVVHDGDVWFTGDLTDAATVAVSEDAWVIPHFNLLRLDADTSDRVLAQAPEQVSGELHLDQPPYAGNPGGTLLVLPTEMLLAVPPDVRFVGWGQEDDAWACALKGLVGPPMRGAHDLWHLWHTPQERTSRSEGNEAGVELVNRYGRVRSDRAALRALVDESKQFWPTT